MSTPSQHKPAEKILCSEGCISKHVLAGAGEEPEDRISRVSGQGEHNL